MDEQKINDQPIGDIKIADVDFSTMTIAETGKEFDIMSTDNLNVLRLAVKNLLDRVKVLESK